MLTLYGTVVSFRGGPKGPSPDPMNTTFYQRGTVRCVFSRAACSWIPGSLLRNAPG
ncbi:hypothetical protein CHELA40_10557 [Chelatococcus asaccharovorans]|nr:hypothetical protein CHELA40_10557 [Chelatococcus asaccharovorans]